MSMKAIRFSPRYVGPACRSSEFPSERATEVCVLGRSNVGKSSFINHVTERSGLARVSKKPGKTMCAHFFQLDSRTVWVDLPGYGFARASAGEKRRVAELIHDYCVGRSNLHGIIWLMDIRHPGLAVDREAFEWFGSLKLPLLPVLTKRDKVARNRWPVQVKAFQECFRFSHEPLTYSIRESRARQMFLARYAKWMSHGTGSAGT